jgi:ferric-dicitrate binding protein FerR (iron transport regulator)
MPSIPDEKRLSELEAKWLNGTITEAEAKEYASWYNEGQDLPVRIPEEIAGSEEAHRQRMLDSINTRRSRPLPATIRLFRAAAVAATLILLIAGLYYYRNTRQTRDIVQAPAPQQPHDIAPGRTRATLTLSNGQTIALDPSSNGILGHDSGVNISNTDSVLTYKGNSDSRSLAFNTLSTAKGEQYSVTLSDGTKVWLNAASILRFPIQFTGEDRRVEVTGEAYFEVARDASKPFFISSGDMHVQVLGTSFNINAYANEPIVRTTLLEGAVRINHRVDLSPHQQSRIEKGGDIKVLKDIDVDEVVAWKNGAFSFNNADITTVMRQLERWYDIEVVYEGDKPADVFYGGISRSSTLMEVLKILQASKVRFRLEGKRLIVLS